MNPIQAESLREIPKGIMNSIILGKSPRNGQQAGADPLTEILKRLENLEKKIEGIAQNRPASEMKTNRNIPSFIKGDFQTDFESKPAEAMTNLIADLFSQGNKKPDLSAMGDPDMILDLMRKLSRQTRKERLMEKNQDAKELIHNIEALFREIPEIESRPDAYEIAYEMVKSRLMKEENSPEKAEKQTEERNLPGTDKESAFVEGKKTASNRENSSSLSPVEREVCKKFGISEKSFVKYRSKKN